MGSLSKKFGRRAKVEQRKSIRKQIRKAVRSGQLDPEEMQNPMLRILPRASAMITPVLPPALRDKELKDE